MAKGKTVLIKLVSMAGTGFTYTSTKNPVNVQRKLLLRKYDPVLGTHTYFRVRSVIFFSFSSLWF
jgi:large subunit ribosomal protein L33